MSNIYQSASSFTNMVLTGRYEFEMNRGRNNSSEIYYTIWNKKSSVGIAFDYNTVSNTLVNRPTHAIGVLLFKNVMNDDLMALRDHIDSVLDEQQLRRDAEFDDELIKRIVNENKE